MLPMLATFPVPFRLKARPSFQPVCCFCLCWFHVASFLSASCWILRLGPENRSLCCWRWRGVSWLSVKLWRAETRTWVSVPAPPPSCPSRKVSLMVSCVSVYTVVTYLKNEMNRGDFFMTLRNQPVALSLYRQVLLLRQESRQCCLVIVGALIVPRVYLLELQPVVCG